MAVATNADIKDDIISSVKLNFQEGLNYVEMISDVLQTEHISDTTVQKHLRFLISKCHEYFGSAESQLNNEIDHLSQVTEEEENNLLAYKMELQYHKNSLSSLENDVKRQSELLHQERVEEQKALNDVEETESDRDKAESNLEAVKDSQSTVRALGVVSLFVPVVGTFVVAPLLLSAASDMDANVHARQVILEKRQRCLREARDWVLHIQTTIENMQEEIASTTNKKMTTERNIWRSKQHIEEITHQKLLLHTLHSKMRKCLQYVGRVSGRAEALRNLTKTIYSLKQVTDPLRLLINILHVSDDAKKMSLTDIHTSVRFEALDRTLRNLTLQYDSDTSDDDF